MIIFRKRIISAMLMFFGLGLGALAQNLDFEAIKVNYQWLPLEPLNEELKTYSTVFRAVDLELSMAQMESMRTKNLILSGFEEVNEDADLTIELIVDVMRYNSKDLLDKSTKRKEGETEVTVPAYNYQLVYDYPYKLIVTNSRTGEVILDKNDVLPVNYIFPQGGTVGSVSQLTNMYEEQKGNLIASIRRSGIDAILEHSRGYINNLFGYPPVTGSFEVGYVKNYKKFDYSDLYSAFEDLRLGLNQIKENWYVEGVTDGTQLNKALDVLEKIKDEYIPGDKKGRINEKVVSAIYLDIATCYFFLKQFEKSEEYLGRIGKKAPYRIEAGQKYIQNLIDSARIRFKANQIPFK